MTMGEGMTEAGPVRDDTPSGWRRYIYAVHTRDIGAMFLVFAALGGLIGFALTLAMRIELMQPGLQLFSDPRRFCEVATAQPIVLTFFCVLPAMVGFGSLLVPLGIGAPSLAFARLGNLSFWLMPFALLLYMMSFRIAGDAGGAGVCADWSLSAPFSIYVLSGPAVDFAIAAILLAALSLLLAAINFVVTILNMRAPGMSLSKMPLPPWSLLIASLLLLLALPALVAADIMLLADRHFGAAVFNPFGGGDPLLYRLLFRFFDHTSGWAVAIVAIGIVGQAIAAFSGRPVRHRLLVVYAAIAAAIVSLAGWGWYFVAAGLSLDLTGFFLIAGLAAVAPAGVVVFALMAEMWGGALRLRAPQLWAMGFLPVFAIGVVSGPVLASPIGTILHGTVFETAHIHYLTGLTALFAFFTAWYFWFPKFSGLLWNDALAKLHFALVFVGANLEGFPSFFLGLAGMPRGVADYPAPFAGWHFVSGVGALIAAGGLAVFFLGLIEAVWRRRPAGDNPWGKDAVGLEWTLSSPPPRRPFDELPVIR